MMVEGVKTKGVKRNHCSISAFSPPGKKVSQAFSHFLSLCSHFLDIMCIMFFSFVAWLWHVDLHNERSVCTDTFVLRHKNTMSDLVKGTRQNMQSAPYSTESSLLNKKQRSSDLQHIILTGLSVPITKRVSNIDPLFWFWVCLCVRVPDTAGAVGERGVGSMTSCIYLESGIWSLSDWDYNPFLSVPFTLAPIFEIMRQIYCHQASRSSPLLGIENAEGSNVVRKVLAYRHCFIDPF